MNIETMRLLVAKGLSADDLLEVAEAMAIKTDRTAAERQARHRAKVKVERDSVTRDVTRDEVTDTPLSLPPKEINSNPPTHTPEITKPARKGTRLSADWQPKPLTPAAANAVDGWPAGAIERELSRFRDWAASANGPNAVKKDWDAAWRQWLQRCEDDGKYRKNGGNNRNSGANTGDAILAAISRVEASKRQNSANEHPDGDLRIGPMPDTVRAGWYAG